MKKLFMFLVIGISSLLVFTGCELKNKTIDGKLSDLMEKLYDGVDQKKLPDGLMNVVVNEDTEKSLIGDISIDYKEALVSESPIVTSVHSVVLIRMNDDVTTKEMQDAVKIFGDAFPIDRFTKDVEIKVVSNRNLILIVLDNDYSEQIIKNFKNLR